MKKIILTPWLVGLAVALIGVLGMFVKFEFSYPVLVENQPLDHPVQILRTSGNHLSLSDGREVVLNGSAKDNDWADLFAESGATVQVTPNGGGKHTLFIRRKLWCGHTNNWTIRIPLWPLQKDRYFAEAVAYDAVVVVP